MQMYRLSPLQQNITTLSTIIQALPGGAASGELFGWVCQLNDRVENLDFLAQVAGDVGLNTILGIMPAMTPDSDADDQAAFQTLKTNILGAIVRLNGSQQQLDRATLAIDNIIDIYNAKKPRAAGHFAINAFNNLSNR